MIFTEAFRRVALTLAVCALGVAQANAASIVYTKDGNVWIANPDGSGQYQVTLDGSPTFPYIHASQSDDGTIVANRGDKLYVLRQNGAVVRTIDTILGNGNPEISPDGLLIAHGVVRNACGTPPTACSTTMIRGIDGTERGFLIGGFELPAWVGNTRLALSSGGPWSYAIGSATNNTQQWAFTPLYTVPAFGSRIPSVTDVAVAPAGDRFAALADTSEVVVYSGNGPFPAGPTYQCHFSDATRQAVFEGPSWSPDGSTLSWGQQSGIWSVTIGATLDATCGGGAAPTLIIPGGKSPDWGPANVNPGARPTPSDPAPSDGALAVTVTAPRTAKLGALRSKGVKVRASFSAACNGVVALAVSKAEAKRLKIGKTDTVIGQVGPARLDAGSFSVTIKLKKRYVTALKPARKMTAFVIASCVVGDGEPVFKGRKIIFTV